MILKLTKWFTLTLIALIVLGVGFIFVIIRIDNKNAIAPISTRVRVESRDELREYMKETFIEGLSRQRVYEQLEKFGEYNITSLNYAPGDEYKCETIKLPTGETTFLPPPTFEYIFCFSPQSDNLKYWTPNPG